MTSCHCNTLQHTVTHCKTLQHTATHCNICQQRKASAYDILPLQHNATHRSTLQDTATHCNTPVMPQMCLVRRLHSCTRTAARAHDDELGQYEQDLCEYPAGHSRAQQTRASCLLPRVLALHRFLAQQRNNSCAGADDQAQNRCT